MGQNLGAMRAWNTEQRRRPPPAKVKSMTAASTASIVDFVSMWINGSMPEVIPLPQSADDLVDWTDEAGIVVAVLQEGNSLESSTSSSVPEVHRGSLVHLNELPTSPDSIFDGNPCADFLPPSGARFRPYVKSRESVLLSSMGQLCWIERVIFFANQLLVVVESPTEPDITMTGMDFIKYYLLLCRWTDLLALRLTAVQDEATSLQDCTICYAATQNTVLNCGHLVCADCERLWVRKRLQCPFCRDRYRNAKQVKHGTWQLTEFSHAELQDDINELEQRLRQIWNRVTRRQSETDEVVAPTTTTTIVAPSRLKVDDSYQLVERTVRSIRVDPEEDLIMVTTV